MKKNINLFVLFIFSFLIFNFNVYASDIVDYNSFIDGYLLSLSDSQLDSIFNFIDSSSLNYDFNVCKFNMNNSSNAWLNCFYQNDFTIIRNPGSTHGFKFFSDYSSYNNNSNCSMWMLSFSSNNVTFQKFSCDYSPYFLVNTNYWIFWLKENFVYTGSDLYSFPDDVYVSFSSRFKNYYNFKNLIKNGEPLYSIQNLLYGNFSLYSESFINIHYCYDNVCESNSEVYSYTYSNVGESISLSSYLPLSKNGYDLDTSISYSFSANQTSDIYVYYVTPQVNYVINYYFDNVFQNNLSTTLQAPVGSTITLSNLDNVKDDIYFLDNSNTYSLVVSSNVNNNYINVYYNSIDVNYDINVYLDDIYYKSYSQVNSGKVGQTIVIDELEEEIDIFTLDDREYTISLVENRELNYVNIYYYSDNYNTKFQDIDTSNKFYISFDWVYIKELFNLNGNYTQTEQFVIVYVVNFMFYFIVFLISYFALKMINKLFSIFKWL